MDGTEWNCDEHRIHGSDGMDRTSRSHRRNGSHRTHRTNGTSGTDRTNGRHGTDRVYGGHGTDRSNRTHGATWSDWRPWFNRSLGADRTARNPGSHGTLRTDRSDRSVWDHRTDGNHRVDGEHRTDRVDRSDRSDRTDRSDRSDRTNGVDRCAIDPRLRRYNCDGEWDYTRRTSGRNDHNDSPVHTPALGERISSHLKYRTGCDSVVLRYKRTDVLGHNHYGGGH